MIKRSLYILFLSLLSLAACRDDADAIVMSEAETITTPDLNADPYGFYLLNEGNMGSNKSTLDFLDYRTGTYNRNIYAERNPGVIKELGDVGNDAKIYRGKLWLVINASHKVEVLDATTGIRVGQVDIPNCRSLAFDGDNAYISSYVTKDIGSLDTEEGAVYRVDINTLSVTGIVSVGYQPEEMAVSKGFLYVANSGGYRAPNYDNSISTVRLSDFKQICKTVVAINLWLLRMDKYGKLWVLSRGNNIDIPSLLYRLSINGSGEITLVENTQIECSGFDISGDRLYMYNAQYQGGAQSDNISYRVVDVTTAKVIKDPFITDGTASQIKIPYGIFVNTATEEVLICDAKNYVSSGTLNSYSSIGVRRWSVMTGDIPAHIAFIYK